MTAISPSSSRIPSLSSPQSQNPISLRLYKVLSANFDDDATREALDTLAELYAPSTKGTKSKEVKADAEADGDAEEELDVTGGSVLKPMGVVAAASPPPFDESVAGDIAARARKSLRRDVESKLAESSRQFLQAFGEVDKVRASCRAAIVHLC